MSNTDPTTRRPAGAPLDLLIIGVLFILTGIMDLGLIVARPDYRLAVFGMRPSGLLGWLAKLQSPTMHLILGFGCLQPRRWVLILFLIYLCYGMINAAVNLAVIGFGWIRMMFLIGSVLFLVYVMWRRAAFEGRGPRSLSMTLVKEEQA